jgi:hypothetical protein
MVPWLPFAVRGYGTYGAIFMNVFVTTAAMTMLLMEFGPYSMTFMTSVFITLHFTVNLDWQFTSGIYAVSATRADRSLQLPNPSVSTEK